MSSPTAAAAASSLAASSSDRKIIVSIFRNLLRKLKNASNQSSQSLIPPLFHTLYTSEMLKKVAIEHSTAEVPQLHQMQRVLKSVFRDPTRYPQIVSGVVNSATREMKERGMPIQNIRQEVFDEHVDVSEQGTLTHKGAASRGIEALDTHKAPGGKSSILRVKPQYAINYGFEVIKEWNEWIASQKNQEKSIQHSVCECWNGKISVTMSTQKPMRVTAAHLGRMRVPIGSGPQYFFPYTVRIRNETDRMVQVLSRFWRIKFSDGKSNMVEGLGVTGEQPVIRVGGEYEYSSYVPGTCSGSIEGYFQVQEIVPDKAEEFQKLKMTILPVQFNLTKTEKVPQRTVSRAHKFEDEDRPPSSSGGDEL